MTRTRNTDDLIAQLASAPLPPRLRPAAVAWAMTGAVGLMLVLFLGVMGLRPDLSEAVVDPITLAKHALPLMIVAFALPMALRMARPAVRVPLRPLWVPAALALILFAMAGVGVPADGFLTAMMGGTAAACLISVTGMAFLPTILGLSVLRRGASTRPALTGALTGLVAGAGIAAGYALHCTEDSPLFFVTWYGLAILLSAAMGAVLGHRLLRW